MYMYHELVLDPFRHLFCLGNVQHDHFGAAGLLFMTLSCCDRLVLVVPTS